MEEIKQKILHRRTLQKKVVDLMLSVLGQGLKVCASQDPMVRETLEAFPEDYVFALGVYGSRHPMILQNRSSGLYRTHESFAAVCRKIPMAPSAMARRFGANQSDPTKMLEIRFKSVEAGWRMMTGQVSAAQAYARHDLIIRGEIHHAMQFLRCIERVEAYLLPEALAKRALPLAKRTHLPLPRWWVWVRMLHVKKKNGQGEE